MTNVSRTLASLMTGVWECERQVSTPNITMIGKALFKGTQYQEQGTYVLDGVERAYFQHQTWMLQPPTLTVLTHSQRVLHVFDMMHSLPLNHIHHCGSDTYEATLHINSISSWSLSYQVWGPKKNYQTIVQFKRFN